VHDNGIEYPDSSEFAKEMKKWDAPKRAGGYNADRFLEFPRMLYKAALNELSGKFEAIAYRDVLSQDRSRVIFDAEEFNRRCQMIVNSGDEYERAKKDGWRESPGEAMEAHKAEMAEIAREAAHQAYLDRNMSERAQAERSAAEGATAGHLLEVPVKARKKPGPKPKNVTPPEV
jgi:hypothetical protein